MNNKPSGGGIQLFTVGGIRISLDLSWFIIFILVFWSLSAGYLPQVFPGMTRVSYWTAGFITALLFFASILFHELSHSFVAMRSGIRIEGITLFVFGGISRITEDAKSPKNEFWIAAAGPLSSFALALVFWGSGRLIDGDDRTLLSAVLGYLAWINLALGVFNLVPGFPLDGGRVLRALWWWRTGSLTRATKLAADVGKGFAILLMGLGALQLFNGNLLGGLWFIFIGYFLRAIAGSGYQQVVIKQSLEGVHVDELMIKDVISVSAATSLSGLIHDYFLRYHFRGYPVVEDGRVLGLVSISDVRDIPKDRLDGMTVGEVMRPLTEGATVTPRESLAEALGKMTQEGVGRLVVVENSHMKGMITKAGLMRFLEIKSIINR